MSSFVLDGRTMQDHYWGIGRYTFNLASALAKISQADTWRVLYNPSAPNTRFDFAQLASLKNIEFVPVPANAFSLREQAMAFDRGLWRGASLYHSPYYSMPYALPLPCAVSLHDLTPLVAAGEMPGKLKRLLYRALHRLAAERANHIFTLSNASQDDLVEQLGIPAYKISVIYPGPFTSTAPAGRQEIERVRAALGLSPKYLLYLGINKPHKNLERLAMAFAQVDTDAVLVIAGHWDQRYPQVMDYVAANHLQERVLFREDIAEDDLVPLMCGATAFVFPSLHEGFGLPPLEAMAVGTPVVCSNASAIPEVVGDAALMFHPLDTAAMTAAIGQVLHDASLREALRDKGLAQARKFSWERTAEATLRAYHKIITE